MYRKTGKYKAQKTTIDGIEFDSKLEARYYIYLLTVYKRSDVILHPKFVLQPKFIYHGKNIREMAYIADFQIDDQVYDTKGVLTADFKLKAKIFKYKYPELNLVIVKYKGGKWVEE